MGDENPFTGLGNEAEAAADASRRDQERKKREARDARAQEAAAVKAATDRIAPIIRQFAISAEAQYWRKDPEPQSDATHPPTAQLLCRFWTFNASAHISREKISVIVESPADKPPAEKHYSSTTPNLEELGQFFRDRYLAYAKTEEFATGKRVKRTGQKYLAQFVAAYVITIAVTIYLGARLTGSTSSEIPFRYLALLVGLSGLIHPVTQVDNSNCIRGIPVWHRLASFVACGFFWPFALLWRYFYLLRIPDYVSYLRNPGTHDPDEYSPSDYSGPTKVGHIDRHGDIWKD